MARRIKQTIRGWAAKRSGGKITITGTDVDDGRPVKIIGVDTIEIGKAGIVARREADRFIVNLAGA